MPIDKGENGMIAAARGRGLTVCVLRRIRGRASAATTRPTRWDRLSKSTPSCSPADARSVPTQASFRFLTAQAVSKTPTCWICICACPARQVDFGDDDTTPSVSSLAYQNPSSQFTLKAGDYDVYFSFAGTSTLVDGANPFSRRQWRRENAGAG